MADTSSTCAWNPDNYGLNHDHPGAQAYYDAKVVVSESEAFSVQQRDLVERPQDFSAHYAVTAAFGPGALEALGLPVGEAGAAVELGGGVVFADPRLPALCARAILPGSEVRWRFQVAQSRENLDLQLKELRTTLIWSFAVLGLGLIILAAEILIAVNINSDTVRRQHWFDKFAGGTQVFKLENAA